MDQITVSAAPWCPDWVYIDTDANGLRFVEELQKGGRTIPTIMFADGSHLLEPSNAELAEKLGLQLRAQRSVYDARERATGRERRFEPEAAFVFVGLVPNTQFLWGIVDLDERGFIVTDDAFATSLEGVFAAGDVRAGATKQVGSAAGEGIEALLAVRR